MKQNNQPKRYTVETFEALDITLEKLKDACNEVLEQEKAKDPDFVGVKQAFFEGFKEAILACQSLVKPDWKQDEHED